MQTDPEQFDALCKAIHEYYTPCKESEDSFYDNDDDDNDDDDPTFSFCVGGVWVDFGAVLNYGGLYQLREGGAYSDGLTYTGRTIKEVARKILDRAHD